MKSEGNGSERGMGSEMGMSPRKAMASGMAKGEGNFGVESYDDHHGGVGKHPDHAAGTGEKAAMADHERAAPPAVHHKKGHMPAQAAPDHGEHHPGGHGTHFNREPMA